MYLTESRFKTYVVISCKVERIILCGKSLSLKGIELMITAVELVRKPSAKHFLLISSVRTSAKRHYLLHISRGNLYDALVNACLKVVRKERNRLGGKYALNTVFSEKLYYLTNLTDIGFLCLLAGLHALNGVLRASAGLVSLSLRGIPASEFAYTLAREILTAKLLNLSHLFLSKS